MKKFKGFIFVFYCIAAMVMVACETPADNTSEPRHGLRGIAAQFADESISTERFTPDQEPPFGDTIRIQFPEYYPIGSPNPIDITRMRMTATIPVNVSITPKLTVMDLTEENVIEVHNSDGTVDTHVIVGELVEEPDVKQLSFSTWKAFGTYPADLPQLSVWVSTDFDGVYEIDHVRDATWTEITDEFSLPDHNNDPNTPSGTVNLVDHIEDADGEVYIGFKYVYDPSKGIRTIWRLEDFLLNDNGDLTEQPDAGFQIVPGDEAQSKTRFVGDNRVVLQIDKDAPEPSEDWVITKGF